MDELKCQNSYQSNHIPNPSVSDSTQLPPDSRYPGQLALILRQDSLFNPQEEEHIAKVVLKPECCSWNFNMASPGCCSHASTTRPSNLQVTKQKPGAELKDSIAARKVQKADREKLRRDRLNEQFTELGNTLDPDRPKNDKASILSDTIQVLKDLTAQVGKLKSEYAALTDESRELTQEKTDLREEKASLKSDIDSLNAQYQQRLRTMYPWAGMDPSMVMRPPSYSYPVPVPLPTGAIPMHPSLQPYPFFGNQNPAAVPNPCSPFVQYMAPSALMEQQPAQQISPVMQSSNRTHGSGRHDSRNKSSDQGESRIEKNEDSNEVATNLELKTPGPESEQELSSGQRISRKLSSKDNSLTDGSSSSRCSSSHSVQALSSNSVVRGKNTDG